MKDQIEKQAIEEMAKVIKSSLDGLGIGNFNFTGDEISTMFAKALYNADYRKQSEEELVTLGRILEIIERQRAEIERLKAMNKRDDERHRFCTLLGNVLVYSKTLEDYNRFRSDIKKQFRTEAIKEFAERIKSKSYLPHPRASIRAVFTDDIYWVAREMTEEQP